MLTFLKFAVFPVERNSRTEKDDPTKIIFLGSIETLFASRYNLIKHIVLFYYLFVGSQKKITKM